MNEEIGRILRSSTPGFAFGCQVKNLEKPYFGALVKALPLGDEAIYGLIYNIDVVDDPLVQQLSTVDVLPKNAVEDQRNNRLLPIEMSVLSVGYVNDSGLYHGFPPRPPLNLDPVELVTEQDEVIKFSNKMGYLRLILRSADSGVPIDQLLVSHIRSIYQLRGNDDAWAMEVIQEVIELLRSDYTTLIPTLEALSDALPILPLGENAL